MRIKHILPILFLGVFNISQSQNYGFLGRKNSIGIQAAGYYDFLGLIGDTELRLRKGLGLKFDHTISRRGLVSATFNQYTVNRKIDQSRGEYLDNDATLQVSFTSVEKVTQFKHYQNTAKVRNLFLGYHYYVPTGGSNAPLGINLACLWHLGMIDWSKTNSVIFPEGNYHFKDLNMKSAFFTSLGLGVGNSAVYFKRIKTDFQLGFFLNYSNSISGKALWMKDDKHAPKNAADIMRYYDLKSLSITNNSFINYSISYLF